MKNFINRRKRRALKAMLKHGRRATPSHKLKTGRTGSVMAIRLRSRRRRRLKGVVNPRANVAHVRIIRRNERR